MANPGERRPMKRHLVLWRQGVIAGLAKFDRNLLIPEGRLPECPPRPPVIDAMGKEHEDAEEGQENAEEEMTLAQRRNRAGDEDQQPKHFDGQPSSRPRCCRRYRRNASMRKSAVNLMRPLSMNVLDRPCSFLSRKAANGSVAGCLESARRGREGLRQMAPMLS